MMDEKYALPISKELAEYCREKVADADYKEELAAETLKLMEEIERKAVFPSPPSSLMSDTIKLTRNLRELDIERLYHLKIIKLSCQRALEGTMLVLDHVIDEKKKEKTNG